MSDLDFSDSAPDAPSSMEDARAAATSRLDEVFGHSDDADTAPPPPWEGKSAEDLWNDNTHLAQQLSEHSQRWGTYDEALGALNPQDAQFLLGFANAVSAGDRQAIAQYLSVFRQVGDTFDAADDDFDPFDPANIDARANQIVQQQLGQYHQQQQAMQHEVRVQTAQTSLMLRARDLADRLGVPELADPNSPAALSMWRMAVKGDGDPLARLETAAKAIAKKANRGKGHTNVNGIEAQDQQAAFAKARKSAGARIDRILSGEERNPLGRDRRSAVAKVSDGMRKGLR